MTFPIKRGINVSLWLSQTRQCLERLDSYYTADDAQIIADAGFDHIRLPVDEVNLWDESGKPIARTFDALDAALDWSAAAGLATVVDLHILRSHHFNAEGVPALYNDAAALEHFADLWADLSDRMQSRPHDKVAYELLNEPKGPTDEDWNVVAHHVYRALRRREPARPIVMGCNWYSNLWHFHGLRIPEGDANLILSFHFYEPMFVTHWQARWVSMCAPYAGEVSYPGKPIAQADLPTMPDDWRAQVQASGWNAPFDRDTITHAIQPPLDARRRTGLQLYCGEFGCRTIVDPAVRRAWLADVVGVLEEHDIAWAIWDYKGAFGAFDETGQDTGVLDILRRQRFGRP